MSETPDETFDRLINDLSGQLNDWVADDCNDKAETRKRIEDMVIGIVELGKFGGNARVLFEQLLDAAEEVDERQRAALRANTIGAPACFNGDDDGWEEVDADL